MWFLSRQMYIKRMTFIVALLAIIFYAAGSILSSTLGYRARHLTGDYDPTKGRALIVGGRDRGWKHHPKKQDRGVAATTDGRPSMIVHSEISEVCDMAKRLPSWKIITIPAPKPGRSPKPDGRPPREVDCVFGINSKVAGLYETRARLKFKMDGAEVNDKVRFHAHIEAIAPHLIAKTVEVGPTTVMPPGQVWIIRANWGWAGKASAVATSTAQMQILYKKYMVLPPDLPRRIIPRVIASEYIRDPLLWNGYKFHARVHVLVAVYGPTVMARSREVKDRNIMVGDDGFGRWAAIMPTIKMITSGKPYIDGDYDDEEIHDTHVDRSDNRGFIPEDIEGGLALRENAIAAVRETLLPLFHHVKLYPEATEAGYDIYGYDIMYRKDHSAVILEVNNSPGLSGFTHAAGANPTQEMAVAAGETIYQECIDCVFGTVMQDVFEIPAMPREIERCKKMIMV